METTTTMTLRTLLLSLLLLGSVVADDAPDTSLLAPEDILLKLFDETGGLRWSTRDNWIQTNDVCSYYGVTCYPSDYSDQRRIGHIQQIDLSSNHLVGTVPSEVFTLPYIESLVFRDNGDLDMRFHGIEEAQYLTELVVSDTSVMSLVGIGNATALEVLHVTNLGMTGPLPLGIYQLSNLRAFYANYNSFTGSLSPLIGNLYYLEELYLYDNELGGQVPTTLGNLGNLKTLSIGQNAFSGNIPSELSRCSNLEILAIHRVAGEEKGTGLSGSLPSLASLSNIAEVYFQNQRLSGSIPSDFLSYAPSDEVVKVDLTGNLLSGPIPESLIDKQRLELYLANNQFTSVDSSFCSQVPGWMGGDVGTLGCNAFLCPPGTYALDGRETSSLVSCQSCATATYAGSIRCAAGQGQSADEKQILIDFYNQMGGHYWQSATNWLTETPICEWQGIGCTDGGSVSSITLDNNGLSNTPPETLFTLPALRVLDLSSNTIDFDFAAAGQATNLQELYLNQCDVTSLEGVGSLSALKKLSVASNYLTTLPDGIFSLTGLEELDISHNRFSGELSASIGSLVNLVHFSCYGNGFSGQLPAEIGNLVRLVELLAEENHFGGVLPLTLNNLVNLQTLSLRQTTSQSAISGSLPAFTGLTQLTSLQLDGNALTGSLPSDMLANTNVGLSRIELLLSDNQLDGAIPSTWASRFSQLFVDLTGNRITSIDSSLCSQSNWMEGTVGSFQCDAILCPVGTFNEFGRKASASSSCRSCPGGQFMGATACNGQVSNGEIDILRDFFSATQGQNWLDNDGWETSTDHCSWTGVTCNSAGKVTRISLEANGLSGTPPPSIFELSSLIELNLAKNEIEFSFSGIESATNLYTLNLSGTNLNSVSGIESATSLVELHLTDNDLAGTMASELFELTNLRLLYMNFNQFEGRIPSEISTLQQLEEFYAFNNRFEGQLPAAIGSLRKLRVLGLSENNFDGTIPPEFEELTDLEVLSIQREGAADGSVGVDQGPSDADGGGLSGPLPAFSRLKSLRQLYLGVNSLSGTIPSNFLDGIEDKTATIEIDLISNKLAGEIPASLARFEQMVLYVADNLITGIPDGLCRQSGWMEGAVGSFQCNAILCPPGTYSEYGRRADAASTCTACPDGTTALYYGSFKCLSGNDQDILDERQILEELYKATQGDEWRFNDLWLDPDRPVCSWYGVSCDGDSVESIHLMNNGLKGQVPASIYQLPSLKEINFAGNAIRFSFTGIGSASRLEYLNLDSTGLTTLSGVGSATSLRLLHVVDNNFGDVFPTDIFSLSGLETLYLSQNALGGLLPATIQTLSNLVYFACSQCSFKGTLPSVVGSLQQLQELRLDQNSFSGLLPSEIQRLTQLKYLDLSNQMAVPGFVDLADGVTSSNEAGFGGSLPSFGNFTQLSELYLQYNRFSGSIPDNFLGAVATDGAVTVNVQGNRLSGALPSSLARFEGMNINIADNMISGIPSELCLLGWNGQSGSSCDFIACGVDSINGLGRATNALPCASCTQTGDSPYFGGTSCGENLERQILDQMYRELGGAEWFSDDGWSTFASVCTRYGVTCDSAGLVKSLELNANNLVGTVSSRIWLLTKMTDLDLSQNRVDVSFDQIGDATSLESLNLSETDVQSLQNIGAGASLTTLRLASNDITGSIPDELYGLTKLRQLSLNYNELSGTISTLIANLNQLEELYLFNNQLERTLPPQMGGMFKIRVLSLGENKFSGSIPSAFSFFPLLEVLSLQSEQTETESNPLFSLPTGFTGDIPSLHSASQLREVYLRNNALGGTIPSNFLAGVKDKSKTLVVDISTNNIHGSIPETLAAFSDLRLLAADNRIDGIPQEICDKSSWMEGLLATNCDALLCPPGTYNKYGRRLESEDCQVCDHRGVALYYGSTKCGAIYPEGLSQREILADVYTATGGDNWNDKTNWMKELVSVCEWTGVVCGKDGQGNDVVTELRLPSNNLQGSVPSIVFYLPFLKVLNVAGNSVGMTFRDIEDAETLEELYFGSANVASLEGLGQASNLRVLKMDRNLFLGQQIPDELFELTLLEELDISQCGFVGSLSSSIGKLVKLESFSAMNNDLEGELPASIGSLSALRTLILSDNNFYGTIPSSYQGLASLEVFAVDARTRRGAGLSGPLPAFDTMPSLTKLDLGSNSLTGTIPSDFLAGISVVAKTIHVYLDSNVLVGTIPSSLALFDRLNIDLSDNEIESIGDGLCDKSLWWDGDVGRYECSAILCPAGTFSPSGRQSSDDGRCEACPDETSPYLGRTSCASIQKLRAKEILKMLYGATGGSKWKNSDGWLKDNVDICQWQGITCNGDYEIESVNLGSNNLVGTPPKEIFELPGLRYLWLYSNPIDFRFDGIENAKTLTSLQLDSTGLKSLAGIGKAPALVDVDVRFNAVSGTLTKEIASLTNLETFFCGNNKLSGPLPTFETNRKLSSLRVGGNSFSGQLPSFAVHPNMRSLDASNNKLSGEIPKNFLALADTSKPIYIDLSSNELSGVVPGSLAAFSDVTLFLRDNRIEGIHPDLCKEEKWNGGDVGIFGCDGILCPPRSSSSTGRASEGKSTCISCPAAEFFGSTACGAAEAASHAFDLKKADRWLTTSCLIFGVVVLMA